MDKETHIQVILCEPGKKARVTTIQNDLKSLQHMVGDSYIECIYPFDDPVAIICDEEGKLNRAELNRSLKDEQGNIYDIIAGPFVIAGIDEENFASLSKEHQEKYCKMFQNPEMFFRVGNEIQSVEIEVPDRSKSPKRR